MNVKVTKDKVAATLKAIHTLVQRDVMVGIPQSDAERPDGSPATNAQIGYWMEFGAPAANIPPRPFLIPGVEAAEKRVGTQLQKGAKEAIEGNDEGVLGALNGAGLAAQNSVRSQITNGEFEPLSPVTLQLRYWAKGGQKINGTLVGYAKVLVAKGLESYPGVSTKPLIVTGQMRNSVTYVVRKKT